MDTMNEETEQRYVFTVNVTLPSGREVRAQMGITLVELWRAADPEMLVSGMLEGCTDAVIGTMFKEGLFPR